MFHPLKPSSMPRVTSALDAGSEIGATITFYPPGAVHRRHAHEFDQVSLLLLGDMSETIERREFDIAGPSLGFKPAGFNHSDVYGPNGALILAINLRCCRPRLAANDSNPGWSSCRGREAAARRLAVAAFRAPEAVVRAELLWDSLALLQQPSASALRCAPGWLAEVRDELRDSLEPPRIDALAAKHGIERTVLARQFNRHYGLAPSVYRLRSMAAKAVGAALLSRSTLTHVAHEANFADQSHLARAVKSCVGLPLSSLRVLLS